MAVVKSDAYGHGMVQVARAALSAGAEALAVALVEEGENLRQAGVDAPVLVLGATSPREAQGGVALGLTLTVCDPAMVKSVGTACRAQNREASVHLKLDTGMGRIGADVYKRQVYIYCYIIDHFHDFDQSPPKLFS